MGSSGRDEALKVHAMDDNLLVGEGPIFRWNPRTENRQGTEI